MDNEKLKARLQRLLALTRSPEENEARTAAHLLVRTCREHGVSIRFVLPREERAVRANVGGSPGEPPKPRAPKCEACGKEYDPFFNSRYCSRPCQRRAERVKSSSPSPPSANPFDFADFRQMEDLFRGMGFDPKAAKR